MLTSKKATILIYILVLISIVMIMAIVVLNNSIMLENSISYQSIKSELSNKIREKWEMLTNYDILVNSDWSWFIDVIWCPNDITMSWATIQSLWVIVNRANSGSIFTCSWSYNSFDLNVIFTNTGYTTFNKATWWVDSITLTDLWWWNLTWTFPSYDSSWAILWTTIYIPSTSYNRPDWFDDDFNNDNYNWD